MKTGSPLHSGSHRPWLALLCLLFSLQPLAFSLRLSAATIIGQVRNPTNAPLATNITFRPVSTPYGHGSTSLVSSVEVAASVTSTGTFAIVLLPGSYHVKVGRMPIDAFTIAVPDDANTYNIATLLTNSVAWTNFFLPSTAWSRMLLAATNAAQAQGIIGVTGGSATNAPSLGENLLLHGSTNAGNLTAFLLLSAGTNTSLRTNGTRLYLDGANSLTNANGTNTIFVSPDGLDANDGLRMDRAKLTLSNAFWVCRNKDQVVMLAGLYTNVLSRHRANDATGLAPINLVGKSNVVLSALGAVIGCHTNSMTVLLISNCHNIVIDGLSTYMDRAGLVPPAVSNAWCLGPKVFGLIEVVNSTAVTIRNCRLDGGWNHLVLFDAPESLVSATNSCAVLNNYLANCGQKFTSWYDGAGAVVSGGTVASGNTIWRTGQGIECYPIETYGKRQPGPVICNNVIQGTVNPAIAVERCLGGTVSGNTIVRTTEEQDAAGNVGIFLKDVTALAVGNNSVRDYINGVMFEGGVSNCVFSVNNLWGGTYGFVGKLYAHKVAGCSFIGNTVSHTHNAGLGLQWSYRNLFALNSFFDAATNVTDGHGVFRLGGEITTNRFFQNRFYASDYTGAAGVQMVGGSAGNEVFQNQFIGAWTAQYTDTVPGGTLDLGTTNAAFGAETLTAGTYFFLGGGNAGQVLYSYGAVANGLTYWGDAPGGGTGGDMYFSKFNTSQFLTNGSIASIKSGAALTNLVVRGGFSAPGSGAQSEAIGASATAADGNAVAVGYLATANGIRSTAIGSGATASYYGDTAIGALSTATGQEAIAIGGGSTATATNAVAIGVTASSTHTNTVVIGNNVMSTRPNEIRLGGVQDVVMGGKLYCEKVITNTIAPVISEVTGARLTMFDANKKVTNSAYAETDFALAGVTNALKSYSDATTNSANFHPTLTNNHVKALSVGTLNATNIYGTNIVIAGTGTNSFGDTVFPNDVRATTTNGPLQLVRGDWGTNIVKAYAQPLAVGTNLATAANQTIALDVDSTVCITNVVAGSVNIWFTNAVDRKWFALDCLADGSARTLSLTNASGLTLNVVNTNGFSVTTWPQIPIAAGKICTLAGRVYVRAGTTNVRVWASVQQ